MKNLFLALLLLKVVFLSCASSQAESYPKCRLGGPWLDNNGEHINAHGGNVLYHDGIYYWFGEHRSDHSFTSRVGVSCYSSTDLINWKHEPVALTLSDDESSDITKGCILERPKVVYNAHTGKFVLWFHLELKGRGYEAARTGVAVSDKPGGPYRFISSFRPNAGIWPKSMSESEVKEAMELITEEYKEWWTPKWHDALKKGLFVKRDLEGGQMARDMTVFVDDDAKAYQIYSSEDNLTLHISELSEDYLSHTGNYVRLAPGGHNEAPAIFKKDSTYWMITSGCTGWAPNEARLFSATSIWGPWTQHPNPCVGPRAEKTFGGQGTYILKVQEDEKEHIYFMADVWNPQHLNDSRHLWLPILFKDGKPIITWPE